jgi:hypothetical protein
MIVTVPYPLRWREGIDDAGTVHEWLRGKGVAVNAVTLAPAAIRIDAEPDPTALIATYDEPPTKETQARAALIELNAIPLNTADVAALRRALILTRALLNYELRWE